MTLSGIQIIELLEKSVSSDTKFSCPEKKDDSVGQPRWTTYAVPSFCASVKPKSVSDLQQVVKFAVANGIPIYPVSTGHLFSLEPRKVVDALEIDLSAFREVSVDAAANTIKIGGGVRNKEVLEPLYSAGKEMPIGGCSSAGIVGVTLGAGLSKWQGKYGLLIDNLLSLELVTAEGSVVRASKDENPELFWGMRGAGFNFGIVTSATFKIYEQVNNGELLCADLLLPINKHKTVLSLLKKWENTQPVDLSIQVTAMYSPEAGGPVLGFQGLYFGSIEEGKTLLKPFIDLEPLMQKVRPIRFDKVYEEWSFGTGDEFVSHPGRKLDMFGPSIKALHLPTWDEFFEDLISMYEKHAAFRSGAFLLEAWANKAKQDVSDNETSFAWREINYQMIIFLDVSNCSEQEEKMIDEWGLKVRENFVRTGGFDEPVTYVSYARGDESQEALYGRRKLERLRALKKRWDPKGVFSFNAPISI